MTHDFLPFNRHDQLPSAAWAEARDRGGDRRLALRAYTQQLCAAADAEAMILFMLNKIAAGRTELVRL
jgi:hypothetical protein